MDWKKKVKQEKKILLVITSSYPAGHGEHFAEKELKVLSAEFQKIIIFPQKTDDGRKRWIPDNAMVDESLSKIPATVSKKVFFRNIFSVAGIMITEFFRIKRKRSFLSIFRQMNARLCRAIVSADQLGKVVKEYGRENIWCYSVWRDDGALVFSWMVKKKIIKFYDFKFHGFDLYDHIYPVGFQPFLYFTLKHVRFACHISKAGMDHILQQNLFPEKQKLFYRGVMPAPLNPFPKNDIFTVFSCSNVVPIKRVGLIMEALILVDFPVKWIHFGSGVLFDELKQKLKNLPEGKEFDLKGQAENSEILKIYETISSHLFIHLSTTEGGAPVAVQEAISFGIPVLAADAGGVREIVHDQTGILLPWDVSARQLADVIMEFKKSRMNTPEFRESVQQYARRYFDAETNDRKFAQTISQIS